MTGIVLIGAGPGAQPHLRSLAELSDRVNVRAVVVRRPERADITPPSGVPVTADLEAVLADPAVQAVIIVTPPATHLDLARRCLAAGKHVLVEKPLEVSLDRAEALATLAAQHDLRFGVVLQHRMRPGARRLKVLIEAGALGPIQAASVRVPWWRPQSYYDELGRGTLARDGGGVLLTQAIHSLDLFRDLTGLNHIEAAQVTTTALHDMETEDYAAALGRLPNGAPASLMATTALFPGGPDVIEIIGTKGTAVLTGGALSVHFLSSEDIQVAADIRSGGGANAMDFDHGPHRDLLIDFLDAIRDRRPPVATAEDALATHRLIDDILRKGQLTKKGAHAKS